MQLTVNLFARAKDLAGSDTITVELPDEATVAEFKTAMAEQCPSLAPIVAHLHVAIGTDYANDATVLDASSQVSCFPPVSGG